MRYNNIVSGIMEPVPFIFPFLDWILPQRRRLDKDLTYFLNMMQSIIEQKRMELINEQQQKKNQQRPQEYDSMRNSKWSANNEKDLVTLMLETESQVNGIMSDNDILVRIARSKRRSVY